MYPKWEYENDPWCNTFKKEYSCFSPWLRWPGGWVEYLKTRADQNPFMNFKRLEMASCPINCEKSQGLHAWEELLVCLYLWKVLVENSGHDRCIMWLCNDTYQSVLLLRHSQQLVTNTLVPRLTTLLTGIWCTCKYLEGPSSANPGARGCLPLMARAIVGIGAREGCLGTYVDNVPGRWLQIASRPAQPLLCVLGSGCGCVCLV